jgi:hypothetical protein
MPVAGGGRRPVARGSRAGLFDLAVRRDQRRHVAHGADQALPLDPLGLALDVAPVHRRAVRDGGAEGDERRIVRIVGHGPFPSRDGRARGDGNPDGGQRRLAREVTIRVVETELDARDHQLAIRLAAAERGVVAVEQLPPDRALQRGRIAAGSSTDNGWPDGRRAAPQRVAQAVAQCLADLRAERALVVRDERIELADDFISAS